MEPNRTRENLAARIDDFRARHDLSEWQFGMHALRNPRWLSRLRDPETGVSFGSIERAEEYMDRKDEEDVSPAKAMVKDGAA